MRPYNDVRINRGTLLREFNVRIDDIEYTWHRDEDDRIIEVFSGAGWQLQLDNQLPVLLEAGCEYYIPAGMWHRLHKGVGNLTMLISEKKGYTKKYDDHPKLKGKQKTKLPDHMQKAIIGEIDEPSDKKIICPNCGTHNHTDVKKCVNCGHPRNEGDWKSANDEGKKKKKTDFDVGGQPQYRAGRTKKQIDRQADLTRKYNAAKTEKQRQKYRDMIDRSRGEEGVNEGMIRLTSSQLSELISEAIEEQKLDMMLEKVEEIEEKKKRKKRKKSGKSKKGLSKAVKKSLDKKADRRCLTRGSVYAEFRKGLAAYYSSGSRKGMSAHQWAHARVNSANPSKSWAVVKKQKKCPKKKKK